jgi:hypothetical protein
MSSSASPAPSSTSSAAAASSTVSGTITAPANLKVCVPQSTRLLLTHRYKVVGIILAIVSGLLIGSSFVFKKKGLLRSQAGGELGEGVAYLKSVRRYSSDLPRYRLLTLFLGAMVDWNDQCVFSSLIRLERSDIEIVMILGEICNFAGLSLSYCPFLIVSQLRSYMQLTHLWKLLL